MFKACLDWLFGKGGSGDQDCAIYAAFLRLTADKREDIWFDPDTSPCLTTRFEFDAKTPEAAVSRASTQLRQWYTALYVPTNDEDISIVVSSISLQRIARSRWAFSIGSTVTRRRAEPQCNLADLLATTEEDNGNPDYV